MRASMGGHEGSLEHATPGTTTLREDPPQRVGRPLLARTGFLPILTSWSADIRPEMKVRRPFRWPSWRFDPGRRGRGPLIPRLPTGASLSCRRERVPGVVGRPAHAAEPTASVGVAM